MTGKIPMLDLGAEVEELWDELRVAIDGVLRSTRFILGPNVEAFEREAADFLGTRHAIGLNSGTDAVVLALDAVGVGEGDEVVTTPFTFVATGEAILRVGARPVFVDIQPDTFNLDVDQIAQRVTGRTRAILPVHLFGLPAEIDALVELGERTGIPLIEDTAQAFGATSGGRKVGSFGAAGTFSFYPSKNLAAYGDAGLVATNDDGVADAIRRLRNHGGLDKYNAREVGYNSRVDELQAAILRVKLPRVEAWNQARRRVAALYRDGLGDLDAIVCPPDDAGHVYHQFTIRVTGGQRDRVREQLRDAGVATATFYASPLHHLAPFAGNDVPLPVADRAAAEVLNLPIGPYQTPAVTERVVSVLRAAASPS